MATFLKHNCTILHNKIVVTHKVDDWQNRPGLQRPPVALQLPIRVVICPAFKKGSMCETRGFLVRAQVVYDRPFVGEPN